MGDQGEAGRSKTERRTKRKKKDGRNEIGRDVPTLRVFTNPSAAP